MVSVGVSAAKFRDANKDRNLAAPSYFLLNRAQK